MELEKKQFTSFEVPFLGGFHDYHFPCQTSTISTVELHVSSRPKVGQRPFGHVRDHRHVFPGRFEVVFTKKKANKSSLKMDSLLRH